MIEDEPPSLQQVTIRFSPKETNLFGGQHCLAIRDLVIQRSGLACCLEKFLLSDLLNK
jgi:hypothetical protein